jgi:hypothetical protein
LQKFLCSNNSNDRSASGTNNTIDLSMHHIRLRSATLHLNALDQSLEIIAKPCPGENDSIKVTVAQ